MKSRFTTVALAWSVMLIITFNNLLNPFGNILDVFCWLAYALIIAVIILWPKTGKDLRSTHARPNWSDRIEFERPRQSN